VKTNFPAGVLVSICSEYDTKSIPSALNVQQFPVRMLPLLLL
jgi:hypothetical protein